MAAMQLSRSTVAALCVMALLVAAASVPAASAYGCYDDCYERCANGKEDPACTKMCTEACGANDNPATAAKAAAYGKAASYALKSAAAEDAAAAGGAPKAY